MGLQPAFFFMTYWYWCVYTIISKCWACDFLGGLAAYPQKWRENDDLRVWYIKKNSSGGLNWSCDAYLIVQPHEISPLLSLIHLPTQSAEAESSSTVQPDIADGVCGGPSSLFDTRFCMVCAFSLSPAPRSRWSIIPAVCETVPHSLLPSRLPSLTWAKTILPQPLQHFSDCLPHKLYNSRELQTSMQMFKSPARPPSSPPAHHHLHLFPYFLYPLHRCGRDTWHALLLHLQASLRAPQLFVLQQDSHTPPHP